MFRLRLAFLLDNAVSSRITATFGFRAIPSIAAPCPGSVERPGKIQQFQEVPAFGARRQGNAGFSGGPPVRVRVHAEAWLSGVVILQGRSRPASEAGRATVGSSLASGRPPARRVQANLQNGRKICLRCRCRNARSRTTRPATVMLEDAEHGLGYVET